MLILYKSKFWRLLWVTHQVLPCAHIIQMLKILLVFSCSSVFCQSSLSPPTPFWKLHLPTLEEQRTKLPRLIGQSHSLLINTWCLSKNSKQPFEHLDWNFCQPYYLWATWDYHCSKFPAVPTELLAFWTLKNLVYSFLFALFSFLAGLHASIWQRLSAFHASDCDNDSEKSLSCVWLCDPMDYTVHGTL